MNNKKYVLTSAKRVFFVSYHEFSPNGLLEKTGGKRIQLCFHAQAYTILLIYIYLDIIELFQEACKLSSHDVYCLFSFH